MVDYYAKEKLQFRVMTCPLGTSPMIQSSVWKAQHFCVNDNPEEYYNPTFDGGKVITQDESLGEFVIQHQLNKAHYSVLNFGFIKLNCYGFPHSTMQQITRHRDSAFLVTSMRYTGEKFIKVAEGNLDVDRAFYIRPPDTYYDRSGAVIVWTDEDYERELNHCKDRCEVYKGYIDRGMPYEMAREFLPFCYRQPFTIGCTVEALFHWLDQRTLKDAEREIQILASLAFEAFKVKAPQFAQWYEENRYGKARLAP